LYIFTELSARIANDQNHQIGSFYGQTQFLTRFGYFDDATGSYVISASWVSGLSNSSVVGQIFGLAINGWAQDRFGCRPTVMFFMAWLACFIFIPVFAPSLEVLCVGQIFCGVGFGVFQVCPNFLRKEVNTAYYVC
jgi:SP family general alpha glucoside:H+ symporter-like MFS transporter